MCYCLGGAAFIPVAAPTLCADRSKRRSSLRCRRQQQRGGLQRRMRRASTPRGGQDEKRGAAGRPAKWPNPHLRYHQSESQGQQAASKPRSSRCASPHRAAGYLRSSAASQALDCGGGGGGGGGGGEMPAGASSQTTVRLVHKLMLQRGGGGWDGDYGPRLSPCTYEVQRPLRRTGETSPTWRNPLFETSADAAGPRRAKRAGPLPGGGVVQSHSSIISHDMGACSASPRRAARSADRRAASLTTPRRESCAASSTPRGGGHASRRSGSAKYASERSYR
eukprot:TRINITY_DN31420_c0_g1_i1.p1 TRINITY_DN31420_c0_g1~~TRINITY_DN31420_c0_g1_i1.p1  ORF type:complete len:291 (-),score=42.78 TRINITY_DN31420_c0_g1_i1:159-995(-)